MKGEILAVAVADSCLLVSTWLFSLYGFSHSLIESMRSLVIDYSYITTKG